MPRTASKSDVFQAIADPRRRELLELLASNERPVGDIVAALRLRQPSVSKHLKVLRSAGLVHVRREGRQMFYRTDAGAIKAVHDWTRTFERFWHHQLLRVKERAERTANAQRPAKGSASDRGGNR
ncbi:MAG TPA: metalloregulator ArsR/SmtB family transcription factor [Bryobacteraceae bacterium]|nr:metalloregulator ArsR/SmtB family transcription factor [Bryobacteraceae bacterium]